MDIILIGFGVVGRGVAQMLRDHAAELQRQWDFSARIVGVATAQRGVLYQPQGLDLDALLQAMAAAGDLSAYPDAPGLRRDLSTEALIQQAGDVVVELSPTNLVTGEPATSYCRLALESGKHLVTANKGPVALHYADLRHLASAQNRSFGIEATVMSGTPALRLGREALAGGQIRELRGILNGTTNYILSEMEGGKSYEEALSAAQALGYAESDPSADVEGYDTLSKVLILANVIFGEQLVPEQVVRQGITGLAAVDIDFARQNNARWKLLGTLRRSDEGLLARVEPVQLPLTDPLAGVGGVMNAISYHNSLLGDVTLTGPGAGQEATAFGILSDLLAIQRGRG